MDIETLALRLEEIKLNRLEVLEEKKVLAEELLDGRLRIQLKRSPYFIHLYSTAD